MTTSDDPILALAAEGLSSTEIAKRLDLNASTVRSHCSRRGVALTPSRKGKGRPPALTEAQLRALLERAAEEGWSRTETARQAGISRATLYNLLARYGLA